METLLLLTVAGIAFIKLDQYKRFHKNIHKELTTKPRDTSYVRTDFDKDLRNLNNELIRTPADAKRFGVRFLGDPQVYARRRDEADESYNIKLIPRYPHIVRPLYAS